MTYEVPLDVFRHKLLFVKEFLYPALSENSLPRIVGFAQGFDGMKLRNGYECCPSRERTVQRMNLFSYRHGVCLCGFSVERTVGTWGNNEGSLALGGVCGLCATLFFALLRHVVCFIVENIHERGF